MRCYPRGGRACIDDVCHSMQDCAWPPQLCPQCKTTLDKHGYCTDPGCVNVGKVPER